MSWENNVRRVEPYVPGEQPKIQNLIKLNTNENPYPPAIGVKNALLSLAQSYDCLRKYPDPACEELILPIADHYQLKKEEVFVGVGSDDVLSMAFLTFFNSNLPILFPDITYSFYDVWAEVYRIKYEMKPLDCDFRLRLEDYLVPNGGIVIANPNAPTGEAVELDFIEEILKANQKSVVIVDEAYIDFGAKSCLPLIHKYENLLVVQTTSKSRNLAGMRVGMAFGCEKLIHYLNDVKFSVNSYTMNMPSLKCASASFEDKDYFNECVSKVIKTREWTKKELSALGFTFPDSLANFIFATHYSVPASDIARKLRERAIIVRHFNKPRIENYLRISIGTDEEMETLIRVLKEILS